MNIALPEPSVTQSTGVRRKPKIEGALPLSNFDGQGGDLLKTFDAFIRGLLEHNELVNLDWWGVRG